MVLKNHSPQMQVQRHRSPLQAAERRFHIEKEKRRSYTTILQQILTDIKWTIPIRLCLALKTLNMNYKIQNVLKGFIRLTPLLWFSPISLNSNSSRLPVLLAILVPTSPAPAAEEHKD